MMKEITDKKRVHILLVEDSETDAEIVKRALDKHMPDSHYKISHVETAMQAKEKYNQDSEIDLILLDLGLPDDDGLSFLSEIRRNLDTPVIIVSGNENVTERVISIEMGADDYITKPYNTRELYARIKAVLRRAPNENRPQDIKAADDEYKIVKFDQWTLDTARYELFDREGKAAGLTASEFKLLEVLTNNAQRVLTRDLLFDRIYGREYSAYDRSIDIMIGRLRKKLSDNSRAPELIKTVHGIGYMFSADTQIVKAAS